MDSSLREARRASLVQDLWLGGEPRLRGRRLAPFDEAPVRVLFHPTLGASLEDPELEHFLERLATRADVVAFEPRGQGASAGRFGPELVNDLHTLLDGLPHRFRDGLPIVLAGRGLGASLALGLAAHGVVAAVVALAPWLAPLPDAAEAFDAHRRRSAGAPERGAVEALLGRCDPAATLAGCEKPLLLLDARDDALVNHAALAELAHGHAAALVSLPGASRDLVAEPWADVIADFAVWAAARMLGS